MITDQITKKVTSEVKEYFLDKWSLFKLLDVTRRKLDDYENIKITFGKKV